MFRAWTRTPEPIGSGFLCWGTAPISCAVTRLPLFRKDADFDAVERVMEEGWQRQVIGILAHCLMKNDLHFVLVVKQEFDALVRSMENGCPTAPRPGVSGWRRN